MSLLAEKCSGLLEESEKCLFSCMQKLWCVCVIYMFICIMDVFEILICLTV